MSKPGNGGNGMRKQEALREIGCPVSPNVRPEECNVLSERMTSLEHSVRDLTRELQSTQRELQTTHKILGYVVEELKIIAAQQGRRVKDPR